MFAESNSRSILKALTWRVSATLITILIVYVFTGESVLAFAAGGVEVGFKFIFYFLHERIWNRVSLGKFERRPFDLPNGAFVLWFTGLPSSGKSTLADGVAQVLRDCQLKTEQLDGDIVREVLPSTGFSEDERNKHVRQMGFVASRLEKCGVCVVASFVSPYRASREFNRSVCANFIEVYVSTPVEECERRDVKGLYQKARSGEISGLTGIDDPYEPPTFPELRIETSSKSFEQCLGEIKRYLTQNKYLVSTNESPLRKHQRGEDSGQVDEQGDLLH